LIELRGITTCLSRIDYTSVIVPESGELTRVVVGVCVVEIGVVIETPWCVRRSLPNDFVFVNVEWCGRV
jgi:hypothetical protein